jgi:hypothetical protein
MKNYEPLISALNKETLAVLNDRVNPKHLLAAAAGADAIARIAIGASNHQRYRKKLVKVAFFDSNVKPVETSEEKLTKAAKLLASKSHTIKK